ncbi:MAG: superoxide dismutase [Ni] [Planctomycetota bacterium]
MTHPLRSTVLLAALAGGVLLTPTLADAHCQVPCGIYGDGLKFEELYQHVETIEASMVAIVELAEPEGALEQQQLVRWTINKDEHATKLQHEAQAYFLAQRIMLPEDGADEAAVAKYHAQLVALHEIIVYAMRCKQTVDLDNVVALRAALDELKALYFDEQALQHLKEHKDGHHHEHAEG